MVLVGLLAAAQLPKHISSFSNLTFVAFDVVQVFQKGLLHRNWTVVCSLLDVIANVVESDFGKIWQKPIG